MTVKWGWREGRSEWCCRRARVGAATRISRRGAAITEDTDGSWSYVQGSTTYKLGGSQVNSIETMVIANNGTKLDLWGKAVDDADFTATGKGSINISGVAITEATLTSQVDADAEIVAIEFTTSGGVTVNGTRADYFITLWDEYDDMYGYLSGQPDGANVLNGAGTNGYENTNPLPQPVVGGAKRGPAALAVNQGFLDLGIEYVAYIEADNEALTTFTAKAQRVGPEPVDPRQPVEQPHRRADRFPQPAGPLDPGRDRGVRTGRLGTAPLL